MKNQPQLKNQLRCFPIRSSYLLVILAVLASLMLIASCSGQEPAGQGSKQAVIKIGATLPLSGDVAMLGESGRNAMQLALSELKNTKYKYELIFEDDKLDPKTAATTATKLMTVDNVDAIVSLSSGIGNVVAPLAEQNKVVHFGIASDPNIAKGTYNFIHWTPPDEQAKVWVEEIVRRGYKRVAILGVQQQGELAIIQSVHTYIKGTGVEIINEQTFSFGEKDFRTMILKSQEARPDIYIILAFSPEIDLLYKQFQELGLKQPVTTIEAFELSNNPAQFEGLWYVNGADPSNKFLELYKSTYGKDVQLGGGNAYDILKLMVEGFERAGKDPAVKPTAEDAAHALMQIKGFQGALGKLTVGEDGIVWSGAVIRKIQGGKPVTIGPYQSPTSQGKDIVVESKEDTEPIKIGLVASLTGEAATYGTDDLNGALLAIEDINAAGGINGRPLKLIPEDDKCNGKDATSAVTKLLEVDGLHAVLGSSCSGATLAMAPVTERARAILFTSMSSNEKIKDAGDFVFRNFPSDAQTGKMLAQISQQKGWKRVALISENTDYSQGIREVFLRTTKGLGVSVVGDERFEPGTQDFKTQLIKIQAANPDALFINPQADATVGLILKQTRELGLDGQILVAWYGGSEALRKAAGEKNVEGLIWVDTPTIDESNQRGMDLLARHKQRFGEAPHFPFWFAAAYERTKVLAEAMKACGENTTCIRDWLYSMKPYDGAIGSFNFDKDGEVIGISLQGYQIRNGKTVKLE